ncbi:MAG: alcohol dehydrogenase [Anaerolineaceae bacterium]|nr:alcohol dehydrogenase [Anaerolineaceae bacterium]|tara:strand:+ start:13459 stop:14409 length:951 start_codon:yes stop_codon:yes gene_type:complete
MHAIWLENGDLYIRDDVPVPVPLENEVLIRVLRAGICNTDLSLTRGYYAFSGVLGHEFVGLVHEGPDELIGQHVVGEINVACGKCTNCLNNRRTHCINRTVLGIKNRDGAFAEFMTIPLENLHVIPPTLSLDHATFTEPLAAALQIQSQLIINKTDCVMVLGAGKLGQLIARSLALTGCELHVFDRNQTNLDLLSNKGIKTGSVDEIPKGMFDISVECTGSPNGFSIACRSLRPQGTLVMKSTYASNLTLDVSELVVDEITLIGSRCGPFDLALELLINKQVEVEDLIHARYPLGGGLDAFALSKQRGVLKVLLDI